MVPQYTSPNANSPPTSLSDRLLLAVPKKGRLQSATLSLLEGSDIQFRRETRLDIALVKNLPLALVFLPAADIPTFVGEGRVDLGITGRDQVGEHDARIKRARRERERYRAGSVGATPPNVNMTPTTTKEGEGQAAVEALGTQLGMQDGILLPERNGDERNEGVEEIMDLGFGKCRLEVQVPERGPFNTPADLVGRNVSTSFTGLAEEYFENLEGQTEAGKTGDGAIQRSGKMRTKVKFVGGSVEAACALGVADGIVDLVGT